MHRFTSALAAAALATAVGGPTHSQTAAEVNRLNAAVQICSSPAGATMAECARLRGRLGASAPPSGVGGGTTANVLGALNASMSARRAPPAPVAAADAQAIAACVRAAAADNAAIQACLVQANAPRAPTPATGVPSLGQPLLPTAQRNVDTAGAIHQGAQSYQACAAANPTNWRQCLPLLNGGQPR